MKPMKTFTLFISLWFVGFVSAQNGNLTPSENYLYTKTCLSGDCTKTSEAVQYYDGLGRLKQQIGIKASPAGNDIVQHIEYDSLGRTPRSYLPVPQSGTQSGAFYTNPLSHASTTYGSEKIYSETVWEESPLQRVLESYAVGNEWSNHPVQFGYGTNTASEVYYYPVSTSWSGGLVHSSLQPRSYYPAGTLLKNSVTDENGTTSYTYTDGSGHTILVRKSSDNGFADTYYVYNPYGQLAFTLPPLASQLSQPDTNALNDLCYQYRYDAKGRLSEKKLPGKGWEELVYDKADRLILSRDAVLKAQGKWHLTKYDDFGRVILTGILADGNSREAMQTILASLVIKESPDATGFTKSGMQVYYTNGYFDYFQTLLTVNYYGSYPQGTPTVPAQILGQNVITASTSVSVKNLPTASYVKNLEDNNWTKNYIWYDEKARSIGSHSINHLGGFTKTESELDFAAVVQQSYVKHKRLDTDPETVIKQTYAYDDQNRLLSHKHQVNTQPEEILSQVQYDELSRVITKETGVLSGKALQAIDYTYNIRGGLSKVNEPGGLGDRLFAYELKTTAPENANPQYNGNFSEVDWVTATDGVLRRYSYSYDAMNRMTNAEYIEPESSQPFNSFFNESVQYDDNGNILQLDRFAKNVEEGTAEHTDSLIYSYTGNRLDSVYDEKENYLGYPDTSGIPMTYDDNGNMTSHEDKGILQIDYNVLNLPKYIQFNEYVVRRNNTLAYVNTQYSYRADGVKIMKSHSQKVSSSVLSTMNTDYLDGFQYSYTPGTLTGGSPGTPTVVPISFVPTAEGYYDFEKNRYIYNYLDHLGNVRLSYFRNTNNSAEVLEETNYYPFGLKHEGYNALAGNPAYLYKYNGKELQESGMYDYGARFYMPEIGRWGVTDALSEAYNWASPYAYVLNNPIKYIDPDGMKVSTDYKLLKNGKVERVDEKDGSENNLNDRLFAVDEKGYINKSKVIQIDKTSAESSTIISDLSMDRGTGDNYGVTNNGIDARTVFQFAADNSYAEWAIGGFKTSKELLYIVGTSHMLACVTPPWLFEEKRLNFDNLFYSGHTHPYSRSMDSHDIKGSKPYIINFIYYTGAGTNTRDNFYIPYRIWVENNKINGSIIDHNTEYIKLPNLIP